MESRAKPRRMRPCRRTVGLRARGHIYRALLMPDLKVGGYTVRVAGLPGCITEGNTLEEAKRMTREAIEGWLSVAGPAKARTGAAPPSRSP